MSTQAKAAEEAAPRATLNVPQSTHCQPGKLYVVRKKRRRGEQQQVEGGGCLAVILFNVNFRCAHVALGKLLVSFFMTRLISSLYRKNIDINIFECVCVCICSLSLLLSSFFWLPTTFDNVNSIEHSRKPTRAAILFVVLVVVVVALNFHLLYIFLYIFLSVCVCACGRCTLPTCCLCGSLEFVNLSQMQ